VAVTGAPCSARKQDASPAEDGAPCVVEEGGCSVAVTGAPCSARKQDASPAEDGALCVAEEGGCSVAVTGAPCSARKQDASPAEDGAPCVVEEGGCCGAEGASCMAAHSARVAEEDGRGGWPLCGRGGWLLCVHAPCAAEEEVASCAAEACPAGLSAL